MIKSVKVLSIILVFFGVSLPASANDIVQQAARERLDAFVAAFNAGQESAWQTFIDTQWLPGPPNLDPAEVAARRLGLFQTIYNESGGLRIHEITDLSDTAIVALVQELKPTGAFEWLRLEILIGAEPPYRVARVGIAPAADPTLPRPNGELTDAFLTEYLDTYLTRLADRGVFSGAVLVARDGVPIYTRVAGLANRNHGVPNTLDTKFNLGSMNKMFTGVAIAQLVEQGRLSFEDTVGAILPDYPNAAVRSKVKVRHLLTHTSGLGSYWNSLFDGRFWRVRSVADYAALFAGDSLLFEPGERFEYSNSGPIVLGLIIEKITGMDYHDYIREHVTGPAGMTNTDCYEIDRPVPNLALGYSNSTLDFEPDPTGPRTNLFLHAVRGGPAGGGYSTVGDLLAFANALRQGTILSPAYVDSVITGKVVMYDNEKYGYLFGDELLNGHRIVGHSGGAPGISAILNIYWDSPFTVAVMGNQDEVAPPIAGQLRRLLTGADNN